MCNCAAVIGRLVPADPAVGPYTRGKFPERDEELSVIASLQLLLSVEDVSLWLCPDAHYWGKYPSAGYWMDPTSPNNDSYLLDHVAHKNSNWFSVDAWRVKWEQRHDSRQRHLQTEIHRLEILGYKLERQDTLSAFMSKTKDFKGFLSGREVIGTIHVYVDALGQPFGESSSGYRWAIDAENYRRDFMYLL